MLQDLSFEIKGGQRVGVGELFTIEAHNICILTFCLSRSNWSRQVEPDVGATALHSHGGLGGV